MIIFDFDGTIADSLHALLTATNRLAREYNYREIDASQVEQLRQMSSRAIIQRSNIPLLKVPFLMKRLRLELGQEIKNIEPIPGIELALRQLKVLGYPLGIVTSNSTDNVDEFLRQHRLAGLFDFTHSATTLFGKHRALRRLINQQGLDPKSIIYVGDETRDVVSAQRISLRVIAVAWGYNTPDILQQHGPNALVNNPSELALAVQQLNRPA
ncbi:MAG: HAD-IA family hydrolase [Cyanobacteria bacterium P01_A01_bin.135]